MIPDGPDSMGSFSRKKREKLWKKRFEEKMCFKPRLEERMSDASDSSGSALVSYNQIT